jgi:hypothetical protein
MYACLFYIWHKTEPENASSPSNCEAINRVRGGGTEPAQD